MIGDPFRFLFARPGGHGCDHEPERRWSRVPELKVRPGWDGQACPLGDGLDFFFAVERTPDLAFAA